MTDVMSISNTSTSGTGYPAVEEITVLCAERVSQMTKTYNDIEAVTRLLEEKERDLELAARIGQTLLSKNKDLASRTENLEEQLAVTNEKVFQLRHEISTKEELLRFYNEDLENETIGDTTASGDKEDTIVNLDFLQRKVQSLEDENVHLKVECTDLKTATDNYEEKEKRLVQDCVKQLSEVNSQVETFSQELQYKMGENIQQKEEIGLLVAQITERQKKINQLTIDNLDLHEKLTISTESQKKVTKELCGMQDKYDEMFEKLEEMQDEMCLLRGKQKIRSSDRHHHHSAQSFPPDSLASELETSLQQELFQQSGRAQSWKVFETAKAAKKAIAKASSRHTAVSSSARTSRSAMSTWDRDKDSDTASNFSTFTSDIESMNSDGYSADMDSMYESNSELGRPGIPGSNDLESALRSLALTCPAKKNEASFEQKLNRLETHSPASGRVSPSGASSTSSLPGYASSSTASSQGFKMSDKLQIIKPLEGSMTLKHWQQLATPHLGGIFEPRDGVQIKGERKLDLKEERYSLSDFEEDEDLDEASSPVRRNTFTSIAGDNAQHMGSYTGLGALADPRTPSPSFLNFRSLPASSDSCKSFQTSTPKSSENKSDLARNTPHNKFIGLAELLSNGESNTIVGRALMRVSSLKATKDVNVSSSPSGNLTSNQKSLLSQSVNCLPVTSAAATSSSTSLRLSTKYKNLPGSRSLGEFSIDDASGEMTRITTAPVEDSKHFTPGMTGHGFLQQLKDRGYSLYGLWAGAGLGATTNLSPSPSSDKTRTSATFSVKHASKATDLKMEKSMNDNDVGDDNAGSSKVSVDNIIPPGSGTGPLGALANFRRGGIL